MGFNNWPVFTCAATNTVCLYLAAYSMLSSSEQIKVEGRKIAKTKKESKKQQTNKQKGRKE